MANSSDGNSEKNRERTYSPEFLANRFQPGVSGNPNGRPRKVTDLYRDMWDKKVEGDTQGRTYGQLVVAGMYKAAALGSVAAAKEIREAVEGGVTPTITLNNYVSPRFKEMSPEELRRFIDERTKKLYGVTILGNPQPGDSGAGEDQGDGGAGAGGRGDGGATPE